MAKGVFVMINRNAKIVEECASYPAHKPVSLPQQSSRSHLRDEFRSPAESKP
jgi:hypothetical protein